MKSLKNIGVIPAGIHLNSDEFIEFHAGRILLLVYLCGSKKRSSNHYSIDGLTKLAKLDFFVRYPAFFNKIASYLGKTNFLEATDIESKMVRFHYGPWDKRYYQVLPYLEARGILSIDKKDKQYIFSLTQLGESLATQMKAKVEFKDIVERMEIVGKTLRPYSGNRLKTIIYEIFDNEVAKKDFGDTIS